MINQKVVYTIDEDILHVGEVIKFKVSTESDDFKLGEIKAVDETGIIVVIDENESELISAQAIGEGKCIISRIDEFNIGNDKSSSVVFYNTDNESNTIEDFCKYIPNILVTKDCKVLIQFSNVSFEVEINIIDDGSKNTVYMTNSKIDSSYQYTLNKGLHLANRADVVTNNQSNIAEFIDYYISTIAKENDELIYIAVKWK